MEFEHGHECPHCVMGCDHDHVPDDEVTIGVALQLPAVRGSRMRHGGAVEDPETGLSLASDNWVNVRCMYCRAEAMTPQEVIPPWWPENLDRDGVRLGICGGCGADMSQGFRPGHNPHRRRRAGRHG
jgi:hypothetical protein